MGRITNYEYGPDGEKIEVFGVNNVSGSELIKYDAVSHEVTIRSTSKSYGAIPITGRENLQLLRDALCEICKIEGIE